MKQLRPIYKALVASLGAALSFLGATLIDGDINQTEVLAAIGTGLAFGFAAWRTPPRTPQ